jgi:type II secretory ATPase GspE/PulE/Tfp pilus assembly ATPase PilB-like protein
MMSPPSDPVESQESESEQAVQAKQPKLDWMKQINVEQAFRLVDSILPFEACLYHQILPLSLEGSRLKLGMVNIDDSAALDYVRRILAYMNCSLIPQPLASDIHYTALSAYLQYADQQKKVVSPSAPPVARRIAKKLAEQSSKRASEAKNNHFSDPHTNPTFLVDSPTELPPNYIKQPQAPGEAVEPLRSQPPLNLGVGQDSDTVIFSQPFENAASSGTSDELEIAPQHLEEDPAALLSLSPNALLEELLGRILSWGIGRLYLEQRLDHGRILWSQNGVLQAVLEELPTPALEGVIQELKSLTHLPATPVQKAKQVEIEKRYRERPLLLRLRLMQGKYGEEATLQVLQGAALKFYRQQQLVNLAQEAMGIAQNLQQKVNEMATYSRTHSVTPPEHLGIYPELDRVLKRIGYHISDLQTIQSDDSSDEE